MLEGISMCFYKVIVQSMFKHVASENGQLVLTLDSEARMPKIKVNINWLKLNFAWVIISIKAFLMQNLRLIALLVLEIWRHKIFLKRRERVIWFDYLPPENRFNFLKKTSFYVQNRSSRPKIEPPCQFQQFLCREKFFHFQNFWDVLMTKEQ